jgi:hypothetical protein
MKAHLPNWIENIIPEGMTVENCVVIKNQHGIVVAVFDTYNHFIEFIEGIDRDKKTLDNLFK